MLLSFPAGEGQNVPADGKVDRPKISASRGGHTLKELTTGSKAAIVPLLRKATVVLKRKCAGAIESVVDRFLLWRMDHRDNDCSWEGDRTEKAIRRLGDKRARL